VKKTKTRPFRCIGCSSYLLLNDKKWLEQKYIVENLSTLDIGKMVGCNCSAVRSSLLRLGIPVRSKSAGHRIKRDDNINLNEPVINGALLGDASLTKPRKTGNCLLRQSSIHYDHLELLASKLIVHNYKSRIKGPVVKNGGCATFRGKIYKAQPVYLFHTLTCPQFLALRKLWYADNGEKIIPKSIKITAETLLHWFLDDGYSYYVTRHKDIPKYTKTIARVQFATQGFIKSDLEWLCSQIWDKFQIKMTPRLHRRYGKICGKGYFVEVSETHVKKFFELIGPCPVKSLEYKWKIIP
jgi:LAGLIDADG DNA endonuclease family